MTTLGLIIAAALILGHKELLAWWQKAAARMPKLELTWQQIAAAGLLVAAVASWHWSQSVSPAPPPPPAPAGPLGLAGLFTGQHGAEDAAVVAALTAELADEIEWDGTRPEPVLTTGVAVDELRRRARELRCRGVSIGSRQPAARDAIAQHLDQAVGTEGGPLDAEQRSAWVKALKEISEAAANVTR
jgi:hypothetical protein